MCLVQKIVSLILYGGNCGKQVNKYSTDNFPYVNAVQVYSRLQKLNVSMSYKTTNDIVTSIGEGHDNVVKLWRNHLASTLTHVQVSD